MILIFLQTWLLLLLLSSRLSTGWSLFGFEVDILPEGPIEQDPLLKASQKVIGLPVRDEGVVSDGAFTCDNGKLRLSAVMVNDDYCDCDDGTDEPGTSACSGRDGAKFFCENADYGADGTFIPTSRINDGVCDCCDGSDENIFNQDKPCPNTCAADGRKYRAEMRKYLLEKKKGLEQKKEYIRLGQEHRIHLANSEEEIVVLREEVKVFTAELEIAEAKLNELETKFREADEANMQRLRQIRRKSLKLEVLDREDLEDLLIDLITDNVTEKNVASLVNDKIRSVYELKHKDDEDPNIVPRALWQSELPEESKDKTCSTEEETCDAVDEEGKAQVEKQVEDLRQEVSTRNEKLRKLERDLKKDYGPEMEWFPLDGKCYESKEDSYTYKMCPYGTSHQNNVKLGEWTGIKREADKIMLLFQKGQKCWNGQERQFTVTVTCASDEKLSEITEPSMCVYAAKFTTPAAC